MKKVSISVGSALLLSLLLAPMHSALAHHSRANFQLDVETELSGTVTRFRYSNPHIYFDMELDNGEAWTIEGHSVAGSQRLGWARDTLNVGDQIIIGANKDRNPDRHFAMINWVVLDDGTALKAFPSSVIPEQYAATNTLVEEDAVPIVPSTDFSGNWVTDLSGRNLRTGFDAPEDLPLTELGNQQLANFSAEDNPNFDCVAPSYPNVLRGPYEYQFQRYDDRIEMMKEHINVEWTVWLDESAIPDNIEASSVGLSIGSFEDENTLVFTSTHFAPHPWGNDRGIDSSSEKMVTSRYQLQPDGLSIEISHTVTDPVYFTEPRTATTRLLKRPNRDLSGGPECDPEISSMHLNFE